MSDDSSSDDDDYADVTRPFHLILNMAMTGNKKSVQLFAKKINYAAVKFRSDIKIAIAPPAPFLFTMRKALKQSIEVSGSVLKFRLFVCFLFILSFSCSFVSSLNFNQL